MAACICLGVFVFDNNSNGLSLEAFTASKVYFCQHF
ncbi:hypothetical protein NEOC65_001385 [Neochlamydia sp. AcF65]|nr:hypothetical protein [Neochlamydia sp. AcF65]MBS4171637.1 hypothetical protein [Neochlamydia sp. AcF95]